MGIIDKSVAAQLEKAFEDDMKDCVELTPVNWKKRCPPWHRGIDRLCYMLSWQL